MAEDSGRTEDHEITLDPAAVITPRRFRAMWAVLAVIAVLASAVLAVTRGPDAPPRLPLALGATGGESSAATADAKMAAPVIYVPGKGLPALGGEAPAYRVEGQVDAVRVRALARALGLTGDPVHQDRLWRVSTADAILEVSEGGGGAWWYSPSGGVISSDGGSSSSDVTTGCEPGPDGACASPPPNMDGPTSTEVAAADCPPNAQCLSSACPPGEVCTMPVEPMPVEPTPPEPTPPADLPSKAEARKIAIDLLTAAGQDVGNAAVTVDGPYEAWYVSVEPRVEGMVVAGWVSSVAVGSKGAITSASGTLGAAVRMGSYPLLDTRAAIDRLNSYGGGYGGGPVPLGGPDAVVRDTGGAPAEPPASTEPGCAAQPDGSEICQSVDGTMPPVCSSPTDPADATCPEPIPYEPPAPIEVVLTDAEQILMVQYAIDGSDDAYLVPGYRFSGAEGYNPEVVAVADASLAPTTIPLTEQTPGENPTPVEPRPGAVAPSGGAGTPSQEPSTAKP